MVFKNGLNDDLHLILQLEAKFIVVYIKSGNGTSQYYSKLFMLDMYHLWIFTFAVLRNSDTQTYL